MTIAMILSSLLWASEPDIPEFTQSNSEQEANEADLMAALIDEYARNSSGIFIGEVISTSYVNNNELQGTQAIFAIQERIRGDVPGIMDVFIPPVGNYFTNDPFPTPMTAVAGDRMVVFVNQKGEAIAHNSLFLLSGGYAWRTKRAEVFLNPLRDRYWTDAIDPSRDYVLVELNQIREQVAAQPQRLFVQQQRRRDR